MQYIYILLKLRIQISVVKLPLNSVIRFSFEDLLKDETYIIKHVFATESIFDGLKTSKTS